ncbi:MAG: dephospho-CoA kinase [Frankiales bacterium]|nr:dephospho-CoA kinase [Frankiales bacterium]
MGRGVRTTVDGVQTIGLTGGIGSGKSTVSALLASYGAVVVDADLLAREVVAPGTPGLAEVVAAFGEDLLRPDGSLDREALGARVFPHPEGVQRLNGLLHPRIGALTVERFADAERSGAPVLVHDVPLLVENGLAPHYEVVVVVDVPPEVQLDRLVRLRGMAEDDARARMARQATREQRLAAATDVLRNDGTPEELEEQVRALWQRLTSGS